MNQKYTLPKLLKRNHEIWSERKVALRNKKSGIWQEYSWKDYYKNVKRFALGLKSLGFKQGEKMCIIGDNEPEWYWGELACQSLQGAVVGIFVDCSPEEVQYIVNQSEAVFILARDQEQTDKILQIRKELPRVRKIIYWAPGGMWSYKDPFIVSFEQVQKLGDEYEKEHPGLFEEEIERGKDGDLAIISYTSGTTGSLKGCMIAHKNLILPVRELMIIDHWNEDDKYFSYVSPAWIMEQIFGITGGLVSGMTIHFPERPETVQNDVREIGPSLLLYHFRMWESLCATIRSKIEAGGRFKRALFKLCLPIGYKVADLKLEGKSPPWMWKTLYGLANGMVFRSLRDKLGLVYTRSPFTGGGSISQGAIRFFHAVGVPLRQIYGSCEVGVCCFHFSAKAVKPHSVGCPLPGVEIKIADNGGILFRGQGIFLGYYKNPEKTAEVFVDGWYDSGDAGYINEEGQLFYLDRMSDMMELEDGKKYPSQQVEGTLRFSPYIRDVIAFGGGGLPYVVGLIQIDLVSVGKWAERQRIAYTTFADLSQKPQVYSLIEEEIRSFNQTLHEAIRVKKFFCLPKELDPDDEELTRDRKLRKGLLRKKYGKLLDAALQGKDSFLVKSDFKYRDGSIRETNIFVTIKTLA